MPLLQVNAVGGRPVSVNGPPISQQIAGILRAAGHGGPVVIMIHGYRHSPHVPAHDPHAHMLSLDPVRDGRTLSWPRHLGFGRGRPDEGLAVAFGWEARGTIWQAYREAGAAARALASLILRLHNAFSRPVDVVAHSLGARVALAALDHLPSAALGRAILLAGAEFAPRAERLARSPAGRTAEFLNVTSRENRIFDLLFERTMQGPLRFDRSLGAGLSRPHPNWIDLRIDCDHTRQHLAALGFPIRAPGRAICHWSGYMRPGLFPMYQALLRSRGRHPLSQLVPPRDSRGTRRGRAIRPVPV